MSDRARDVLEYLGWWDYLLWRERHRMDPSVEWQPDLSWDEVAAAAGVDAPQLAPGDRADSEINVELYWPAYPPAAVA